MNTVHNEISFGKKKKIIIILIKLIKKNQINFDKNFKK